MIEPEDERPGAADADFGARFLEAYKRFGGGLSAFSYAELQELKACDREGLIAALRRAQPLIPYAAIQRIRAAASPEALAEEVRRQEALRAASAASSMWMMFLLLS